MTLAADAKKLWQTWDIRGFVLLSLFLQVILLFGASFRKRSNNFFLQSFIWLAYLLSDTVATFTVGLIAHGQLTPYSVDRKLVVFWTPFLLLHLGGPDTITAFSLEDNELWSRHLLQFMIQVATSAYVFIESVDNNPLLAPTLLVFLAGMIKYGGRIYCLRLASFSQLLHSVFSSREELERSLSRINDDMIEEDRNKRMGIGTDGTDEDDRNKQMLKDAFWLFKLFQRLIVDFRVSEGERWLLRRYTLRGISSANEAFTIAEMELNLCYDYFHTKSIDLQWPWGYVLRFASFSFIVAALISWCLTSNDYNKADVKITFILLFGAISMDVIGFIMLGCSDWVIGKLLTEGGGNESLIKLCKMVISMKRITKSWCWYSSNEAKGCLGRVLKVLSSLREPSISQYENLYSSYEVQPAFRKLFEILKVETIMDRINTSRLPIEKNLLEFIFTRIKKHSESAETREQAEQVFSSLLTNSFLVKHVIDRQPGPSLADPLVMRWLLNKDVQLNERLHCWQLTTVEIESRSDEILANEAPEHRRHCRILRRYMVYLAQIKPTIVCGTRGISVKQQRAQLNIDFRRIIDCLSDLLLSMEEVERWKLLSAVWVDLLCYTAQYCRPNIHVAQVSGGRELITSVWMIMTLLGIGNHFVKPSGDLSEYDSKYEAEKTIDGFRQSKEGRSGGTGTSQSASGNDHHVSVSSDDQCGKNEVVHE